jgi:GNAT superfamily N-acetyltransferase
MAKEDEARFFVRQAMSIDNGTLIEFNVKLALETENLSLDPSIVSQGVRNLLDDPSKGRYFIACEATSGDSTTEPSIPVGQLAITYEWSDWRNAQVFWIQSVYVRPEHRKRGCFKALFRHVCDVARAEGACGVRLYADVANTAAQQCYERLGMVSHYKVFERMEL